MMAGTMDRQIALQQNTPTRNATGESVPSWSTVATVWAQKVDARGAEAFKAAQVIATRSATFRIYWRADVTTAWRVLFEGVAYNIVSIAELGRRGGLELSCKAQD